MSSLCAILYRLKNVSFQVILASVYEATERKELEGNIELFSDAGTASGQTARQNDPPETSPPMQIIRGNRPWY